MAYTKEQIEEYTEILNNFKRQEEESNNLFTCWNCQCLEFYVESGFYMCES